MKLNILIFTGSICAQFICETTNAISANQRQTFALCVNNVMTDPTTGKAGFTDPTLACQSIKGVVAESQYNRCVCDRGFQALSWYQIAKYSFDGCAGSANRAKAQEITDQYCGLVKADTNSTVTMSTLPALPSRVTVKTTPTSQATFTPPDSRSSALTMVDQSWIVMAAAIGTGLIVYLFQL
jgi:hypothetical protein